MATKKSSKPAKKAAAKKPVKKAAAKKTVAQKVAKKAPVKKATVKKAATAKKAPVSVTKDSKKVKKTSDKAAAKKTTVKKAAPKKAAVKKTATKKVVAKKETVKKAAAKKTAVKKTTVKKAAVKQVAPKKAAVKKVAVKKAEVKPVAKKAAVKKAAPKAATPAKKAAPQKPVTKATKPTADKSGIRPSRKRAAKEKEVEKVPAKPLVTVGASGPSMPRVTPMVAVQVSTLVEGDKTRYSDSELDEFRNIINAKLDEARRDYDLLKQTLANTDNNGTEDTSPSFKMIEDGSETLSREETAQLAGRQEKFIKHLEDALLRIRNKTYGICRVTGKLISKERLRLVPHATLSIEAKQQMSN